MRPSPCLGAGDRVADEEHLSLLRASEEAGRQGGERGWKMRREESLIRERGEEVQEERWG